VIDQRDSIEEQFTASLSLTERVVRRSRFVVDAEETAGEYDGTTTNQPEPFSSAPMDKATGEPPSAPSTPMQQPVTRSDASAEGVASPADSGHHACNDNDMERKDSDEISTHDAGYWKDEVAARLNYYRARRKPRPPRYPSLRLKFEGPARDSSNDPPRYSPTTRESVAFQSLEVSPPQVQTATSPETVHVKNVSTTETAQIIEFPRAYELPVYAPPLTADELAEPVFDRPRIVEVPETEPPAPALGGIVLEGDEPEPERRPGFEIPLQSAPLRCRLFASACDASVVFVACGFFFYVFFRIAGSLPPLQQMATVGTALAVLFWATFQYLLLTYAGTTPGLRLARLRLSHFDGSPVDRCGRRWRVLASLLSGLSLGLGYAWCFLDEDALCWHDRITRTYLAPL
jgi:uncharacterized RDD family membrane protein YckC